MASKKAASPLPLTPPLPVLDEYEEGEDEIAPCIIKVQVVAAMNVWVLESGEEKSKIGFDIRFPEEPPPPPPDPALPLPVSEAFLPCEEPIPKGVWPMPPPPPSPALDPASPLPDLAAAPPESPPPQSPANFTISYVREYTRRPSYRLCNRLVQEEMVITVYWISPSGITKAPIATAKVNLAGLLNLPSDRSNLEIIASLTPYVEPVEAAPTVTPVGKVKKAGPTPPPKKGSSNPPPAAPVPPAENKPLLLDGATLKISMNTSTPLVTEADRKDGFVMEIGVVTIRKLPPKVQQYGTPTGGVPQTFNYTVGFPIPGFTPDSTWWNSVNDVGEGVDKASFGLFKATTGSVMQEEVMVPKVLVPDVDPSVGPCELKRLLFGSEEVKPDCHVENSKADEFGYPAVVQEVHNIVVWKETGIKRYLTGQGANELRENLRKKKKCIQGTVARYVTEESFNTYCDPFFDRYRATFDLDLKPFLDKEGSTRHTISCPLKDFVEVTGGTICLRETRPSKGKPVEDDFGPPPVAPVAAKGALPPPPAVPLPNAWAENGSVIFVTIKTSSPIEPVWTPPPEPELEVEDLIPNRPKCLNLHDAVNDSTNKFKEFVKIAAQDISSLHKKVLQGEEVGQILGEEALPATKSRKESDADVRRKVVWELHKSGAWQMMRDEMKSRVLKIAAEKFRLGQNEAITGGKFEFCNSLYINLMEEIHTCIADMFLKKHRIANALEGYVELSEKEKKLFLLRQLADEYEYACDYGTANRYHQDRLLGDTIHNPDIWFEYGCFALRMKTKGRPRERGKAEECFREALTLDKNHFLSLLALASLMWHRNYCTQSEILLHTAINLHTEEEWLSWCILSQVYNAQGQTDNEKSCIRKAEVLYTSSHGNRNAYTAPHVLLSPLLKFPFSCGHLFLQENLPSSTVFFETGLFLLDLHLQKEGKQILDLECDVFSTAFDNKWAHAKVHELNEEYAKAEIWIKENLSITHEEPMSWLCLGRIRYLNKKYQEALEAYEKHIRYQGNKQVYMYVHLDIGNCHLQLGNYNAAKKVFLKLCQVEPTTSSWLGAAIAFYRTCEHKHSEQALVEANHMDSKNQRVWAYLALVCLALDRNEEAEISFQQLQKLELHDVHLLLEVADGFAKCGNYRDAEAAAMAVRKEEEGQVLARFKLGELYHQQGKLECAKLEYESIMKRECATGVEKSAAEERYNQVHDAIAAARIPSSDSRVTI